MRKWILVALALLLTVPAFAQGPETRYANFGYKYDVASSTTTYCRLNGIGGDPFAAPLDGRGQVETSGSSTTVTGVNAADDVFEEVAIGDVLYVTRPGGTVDLRVVTAKASADQVTVETAVDWSGGFVWRFKRLACGTTADDGWISVDYGSNVQLTVQYDAGDLDTLDVTWFCREAAAGSGPIRVYPGVSADCGDGTLSGTHCEFASPGTGLSYKITDNVFAQCRIGVAYGSTDGATREAVTMTVAVGR